MRNNVLLIFSFLSWIFTLPMQSWAQEQSFSRLEVREPHTPISSSLKQKLLFGYQQSEIQDSALNPTTISQIAFRWTIENRSGWEFGAEGAQSQPSTQAVGNLESQWKFQRLGLVILAPLWKIHPFFSVKLEGGNFWAQTQVQQNFAGETLSVTSGLLPYFKVGPTLVWHWWAITGVVQWHGEYSPLLGPQPNTSFSAYLGLVF